MTRFKPAQNQTLEKPKSVEPGKEKKPSLDLKPSGKIIYLGCADQRETTLTQRELKPTQDGLVKPRTEHDKPAPNPVVCVKLEPAEQPVQQIKKVKRIPDLLPILDR